MIYEGITDGYICNPLFVLNIVFRQIMVFGGKITEVLQKFCTLISLLITRE